MDVSSRDKIIVALDAPNVDIARGLVASLVGRITFFKVGLELAMNGGLALAGNLTSAGHRVFLDMKFLDIGNTVERAVANVAQTGATFLTVHGTDAKTLEAAVRGAAGSDLKILAVTVMTNLDAADLAEQGISGWTPADLVMHRARLAKEAGCHGVIASALEARAVRKGVGDNFLIVTPGIRLAGDASGDQARVATPDAAIRDGADYLVVGRPITAAADPAAAADRFIDAVSQA